MESALSTISILPANRKEMNSFIYDVKRELRSGAVKDPLRVKVKLTILAALIKELLEDDEVDEIFLREFLLYDDEKIIEIDGAKLSQRETGVKYLYDDSGDPVWNDLSKQIAILTEKRKEREKLLQTLPHEGMVDPGTGVFITRPPKKSKTKVVCTIS